MNDINHPSQIIEKVEAAIQLLFKHDSWLLVHNLSEQSITHKLAVHLQSFFQEYHIDCEYNGNIERGNGKKRISVLKSDIINAGLLKKGEEEIDGKTIDRAVFPDIIIHQRGTNEHNLCVIEVKKSSSKVSRDYDFLKLKAYTSNYYGNDLNYKIGVFLDFKTGTEDLGYHIEIFQDGNTVTLK
jgi:hypothetical protein